MTLNYDSPTSIREFLEAEGLAMSKRFGQNFLVDRNARERLYKVIGAASGARIWEIGPGIGSITALLLRNAHPLVAFEIDHGFARVLRALYSSDPNFRLVEGDFLKTWKSALSSSGLGNMPDIIFGNLPYNAALAIVADLLEHPWLPPDIVFTVQKEAARRIVAKPGTKDYSAFTVLCSSVCRSEILYDLGAAAFWPQPRVVSSVVRMRPRPDPIAASDRIGFSRFVRATFSSRRKTLRNNLIQWNAAWIQSLDPQLEKMGFAQDVRAEALSPEALATLYFSLGQPSG
ncbi:MAG: ksgA [Spirochaetes bacterium]|nr:MAG: ksgA [Spirochaetota bacterium]